jgi:hypothetical protein
MHHTASKQRTLAVRTEDYVQQVSPLPFVGLPREELERLYGAIEVLAPDRPDASCVQLAAYAVIHYNYAWLTGLDGPGTLGKRVTLHASGEPPLFLDDALHALARAELEAAGLPNAPSEWRCAGLIHHDEQLALVYVVRLRQRWVESAAAPDLRVVSNGELQTERKTFDGFGQHLIRNLPAL